MTIPVQTTTATIIRIAPSSSSEMSLRAARPGARPRSAGAAYNTITATLRNSSPAQNWPAAPVGGTSLRPTIRIRGEPFFVERDNGTYYIRHPRWSLLGVGDSLGAAQRSLLEEASQLAMVMQGMSPATMDLEARRLLRYVLRTG